MSKRQHRVDTAIGEKIRYWRTLRGVRQADLALKIGVTFQQLQKYEKGTNRVSIGRFLDICAALNMPPEEMIGGESVAFNRPRMARAMLAAFGTLTGEQQDLMVKVMKELGNGKSTD